MAICDPVTDLLSRLFPPEKEKNRRKKGGKRKEKAKPLTKGNGKREGVKRTISEPSGNRVNAILITPLKFEQPPHSNSPPFGTRELVRI